MEERANAGDRAEAPGRVVRFGPFELDLRSGELRKDGRRVRLQEQPFQILRMLLESPGEVVTREDIRNRLWPDGTIVEFDHSINAAVKRLRDALRDSADKPRYIETLARRGYRFIAHLDADGRSRAAEPVIVMRSRPADLLPKSGRWRSRRLLAGAAFAGFALLITGATYYIRRARTSEPPLRPLTRLDLVLGLDISPRSERGTSAILSPDGTRLVYLSQSKLFVRPLDRAVATELAGTERAQAPFFSPDGKWVAFFATHHLKKVSLESGQVAEISAAELADGASWGDDGGIVAAVGVSLSRIPSAGGAPTALTVPAPGELAHRWPQVLPGAKAVLFSAYRSMTGLDGATIEAQSFKTGNRKTLVRGAAWARYLESGHLVYLSNGTLFAVPFDADRLETRGAAVPVLEDVAYSSAWGSAQVDFSRTGALVYRSSRAGAGLATVEWLDASGNTQPLLPVPGNYLSPTLSPDGRRLALTSAGDVWVYELGRESMMRLSFGGGHGNPLWTPDGRYIAFRGGRGIFWTRADGAGEAQPLIENGNLLVPWSFTADGKRLLFVENRPPQAAALWTAPVEVDRAGLRAGRPDLFLERRPFALRAPCISPDGHWVAYMSNETGTYRVYVEAFPRGGGKRQISGDGGTYPAWSRNGRELFYWQFDEGGASNRLMAASCETRGSELLPGKPRVWSERQIAPFSTTRSYDPAPDGRIVALMPSDAAPATQGRVIFLLNFFDELRRRAPLVNSRP